MAPGDQQILLETVFKYYHIYFVKYIQLLNLKYLFAPVCAFHMYAVGYKVYHHPLLLLTWSP
jgi:hypothetical protein